MSLRAYRLSRRFIMESHKLARSQVYPTIRVKQLADLLKLPYGDALGIARRLEAMGYIKLEGVLGNEAEAFQPQARLYEEGLLLSLRPWERAIVKHGEQSLISIVCGVLGAALTFAVIALLKWLFSS